MILIKFRSITPPKDSLTLLKNLVMTSLPFIRTRTVSKGAHSEDLFLLLALKRSEDREIQFKQSLVVVLACDRVLLRENNR